MIPEIITNNITNRMERWIGRYIFKKTKLRYQFKERLNEIVADFADAMSDRGRNCSMESVISAARIEDKNRNAQIQEQLRVVQVLREWYSEFRDSSNFMPPKHISRSINEFARILYETNSLFERFFQVIINDQETRNRLKNNSSCYPYFDKIYDQTTIAFEKLCKEASKHLKNEFKELKFTPLPRL